MSQDFKVKDINQADFGRKEIARNGCKFTTLSLLQENSVKSHFLMSVNYNNFNKLIDFQLIFKNVPAA